MSEPIITDAYGTEPGLPMDQDSALAARPEGILSEQDAELVVRAVERNAKLRSRMLRAIATASVREHWIDFEKKPWLTGDGAHALARAGGISISDPEWIREEWLDDDYFCECVIHFSAAWSQTVPLAAIGDCSTLDKFYGADGGVIDQAIKRAGGNRKLGCLSLVGWIRKKAVQNGTSRGIRAFLGLGGLEWDSLAEFGFTRDKAGASVKYGKGKSGGKIKHVPLWEIGKLTIGSQVATDGWVTKVNSSPTSKGGNRLAVSLGVNTPEGDTVDLACIFWGEQPDWCQPQAHVAILQLKVGEYNGRPQYTIGEWELIEEEAPAQGQG